VSFVEKALNRLKSQERGQKPAFPEGIATLNLPEPEPEPAAAAAPGPAAHTWPTTPPAGVRLVSFNHERMREEGFFVPEKYQRQMADDYRRIKRPLIANAFGIGVPRVDDGNLVLITSALSGEGKTHTCINLALSLATERDRTVLLVDGDVPKPHISRLFGIADQPGLLDALGDEQLRLEDLLIRTDIPRLSVLPAGRWNDHATEMLASGRMRELCRELGSRYPDRIILFDSPPLLAATEAQAIGAVVGQVALVVAEGLTSREAVRSALNLLDDHKPVNAILNKSRRPTGSGYYGSYGSYGGSGSYGRSYGDREEMQGGASQ
jgi:protein-tyrosine kinase